MDQSKYSYVVNGETINLDIDHDHIALQFNEPSPKSTRAAFVEKSNQLGEFFNRQEIPGEKFTIFKLAEVQKSRPSRFNNALTSLNAESDVKKAMPVFKSGNKKVIATNKILVGFDNNNSKEINKLMDKFSLTKIEDSYNEFLFEIPEDSDVFTTVQQLAKEPIVNYAEPDFVTIGSNSSRNLKSNLPNPLHNIDDNADLSGQQYVIKITQADEAWKLQKGNRKIRIAILDEGVEMTHPDFKEVIEKSFDATDGDTFQEPNSWDGHGTACCGLAAARHKSFGVKGLSSGCSVFAVRLAYSNVPNGDWVTSNSIIKNAIDWSWESGADILSNSWGGGTPSNAISAAFERARTKGRKGKGCVIVIAAGNEDAIVAFPGTLKDVLTVSASNEYDEPKTKTSRDGEYWWGSCFGPEVDIAAPGVHNLTTDITGIKGYNKHYNYTDFNGTSSATPIVSGIAGLILSANPHLTEEEVRTVIKETADKVGNFPYYQGHNDRMGFGRINAFKAIAHVLKNKTAIKSTPKQKGKSVQSKSLTK
jgi:subtilisin family serine protease